MGEPLLDEDTEAECRRVAALFVRGRGNRAFGIDASDAFGAAGAMPTLMAEVDRLRAEVAAKDADLAGYKQLVRLMAGKKLSWRGDLTPALAALLAAALEEEDPR